MSLAARLAILLVVSSALYLIANTWAVAQTTTLRDLGTYGPVVDVRGYVARWPITTTLETQSATARELSIADFFPVQSPKSTPGKVLSRPVNLPFLQTPLCIVGADPLSLDWLKTNSDALHQAGAHCIATNLASIDDLKRVRAKIPGLIVMPASVDDLLSVVGISTYPVLLSRHRMEQ